MTEPQSFQVVEPGVVVIPDPYGRAVVTDRAVRCSHTRENGEPCNRLLALIVSRPWRIQCPRCKSINQAGISLDGSV